MTKDFLRYHTQWTVRRYADQHSYETGVASDVVDAAGNTLPAESIIDGNVLLNEGIALVLDLLIGESGTALNNSNAYIGVGESNTSASASQTGLLGDLLTYRPMETGYPQRSGSTVTWRSVFGPNDANNAWNEFTVSNSNSNSGVNLNRRVSNQGVKASGQTWTLDVSVTLS